MTVEHLQPLLDHPRDLQAFLHAVEKVSRAHIPRAIQEAIRLGRLTALQKRDGGVRGIVAGDIVRRLVARTMSQQLMESVQAATAPFQYAMSTRSGCECIAHALQGLTELDPRATVMSIDGISAYDLISRRAMLQALADVDGGSQALPFVSMFYGAPSQYLWEDSAGRVHTIRQGEGGEQGDAMMPLLFSLGQHSALLRVQERLHEGEVLLAFLDDICTVTKPERVRDVHRILEESLWSESGIRVHQGKTKMWNAAGEKPPGCEVLERTADPTAVVWRGSEALPPCRRGIKVLGTPLGHQDFVTAQLEMLTAEHQTLLCRIPLLHDVQAAWLLLVHCAAARANYVARVVEPGSAEPFCQRHDAGLWQCLCAILQISPDQGEDVVGAASMPLVLGGLGLRSACRVSQPAYWASWADALHVIHNRHPEVAAQLVTALDDEPESRFLCAAERARRDVDGVMGFEPPSWQAAAAGARPEAREPDLYEPGTVRQGWQHEASSRVEQHFRASLFTRVSEQVQALVRSQAGAGAGSALTVAPTSRETTIPSHLFRVILLRRLRLALPLSMRNCRCGQPLDSSGHHRAACARAGMLGRRGFTLESVAARICREAGGRVRTNMFVRDMDLDVPVGDGRRLEVVVDGLPLHGGAQLAVDTTLVCALHADGRPRRGAAIQDGVALRAARRKKVATYPELVGPHSRAKLVVLGVEVGGRWSEETRTFLSRLAKARARTELPLMRRRAEQAWRMRWGSMLACAAAKAVASSLLDLLDSHGGDGKTPTTHEVETDHRHAGLS